MQTGKVYLIGAGPGDPGLITVKAVECLKKADVVVYDFLANPALLSYASPDAEIKYVGKSGSKHTLPQEGINKLIIDLAKSGKIVARLKGGDPYVFGRGGEEAEELIEAGIMFEAVPGVTSAVAAPAYAGIPVTHRDYTSNVGFITGHEDPTKDESALDWEKIATGFGTLVFLMGVKNLPNIVENLIKGGRDPETPAALVRWGSTPRQFTVTGKLNTIVELARKNGMKPPAIFIVGGVVELREKLNWFERLPLFGRTIMVTRTREQAGRLRAQLAELGARVIECPTIKITPPDDWMRTDLAIDNISDFDWLVLTSPNGVDWFFNRLRHKGLDARALAGLQIAAIGPATAEKLRENGVRPDLLPERFVAEGLIEALSKKNIEGRHILLARASEARDVLPRELGELGAVVTEVALYRTVPPDDLTPEALEAFGNGEIDLITFTSSSTVTNFVRLMGEGRMEYVKRGVPCASIGPVTSKTAEDAGVKVSVEAEAYTIDGLVDAIVTYFQN